MAKATHLVVAAGLTMAAIWLVFDNPDINNTSRGDNYPCLAPYDTVLNDASNEPGGETPPDADDIASRCRDAGQARFNLALAVGAAAILANGYAAASMLRRSRSTKKGE